ncbi:DUF192 domain-containing protein, partial [Patescibacteria group bacterium]|nr:DUF192 domain-containing protein [Patescibacteria group bacterium]
IHNSTFNTEVARTQKAREKGLRNRKSLSGDRGMLFVFDQADIYSFTMVDTLIPLDIIWILDNRIVEIKQQAEPGESLITPTSEANYVLEIRGGSAESLDINTGSTVDITFDKNDES